VSVTRNVTDLAGDPEEGPAPHAPLPTHTAQAVERIASRAAPNFPAPARHREAVTV